MTKSEQKGLFYWISAIMASGAMLIACGLITDLVLDRSSATDDVVQVDRAGAESNEQAHVRSIANLTRLRIMQEVRPAMKRTELLAIDPRVISSLRACNRTETVDLANDLVRNCTELDMIALFDSQAKLCGFSESDADGKPYPKQGVQGLYEKSFQSRQIIRGCLGGVGDDRLLEFQMHCDFSPALTGSRGLAVACSVTVSDPETGAPPGRCERPALVRPVGGAAAVG